MRTSAEVSERSGGASRPAKSGGARASSSHHEPLAGRGATGMGVSLLPGRLVVLHSDPEPIFGPAHPGNPCRVWARPRLRPSNGKDAPLRTLRSLIPVALLFLMTACADEAPSGRGGDLEGVTG